jgi:uroporphyrinogen-III synthase
MTASAPTAARPLVGRRIAVTRAPHQNAALELRLRERGAVPVAYPCIDIVPPADAAPLDVALRAADEFDWLVLTSANAVLAIRRRLDSLGLAASRLAGLRCAAVGPSTAAAAGRLLGLTPAAVPEDFLAAALVRSLPLAPGARVLLAQSEIADRSLVRALEARGARVVRVDAYRTVRGRGGVELLAQLRARQVDAVTLASASAAEHLVGRLTDEGGDLRALADTRVVCIGPRTAAAALRHGVRPAGVASEHDLDGLISALELTLACTPRRRTKR